MKKILFLLVMVLLNSFFAYGQLGDSTIIDNQRSTSFLKNSLIPLSLITIGVVVNKSQFERDLQAGLQKRTGGDFDFPIDDYLRFAPVVEMYAGDILGVEAKNHWFDQSKNLFFSNALTAAVIYSLKSTINKQRPNGEPESFPSGHTGVAFTNAAVLRQEFKDTAPVFAYSGFAFAVATGSLRMLNDKHWASDVLVSAGIGLLATEVIYRIEPLKNFNPFKKVQNMALIPQVGSRNYGFYWAYQF